MPTCVDTATSMIDERIASVKKELSSLLEGPLQPTGSELQAFEKRVREFQNALTALYTARKIQQALSSEEMKKAVENLLRDLQGKFRFVSWRPHVISFLGGMKITIYMPYYSRKCAPSKGITPHLMLFGIIQQMTPGLASLAAMLATALSSYVEATRVLGELGVSLCAKTVRAVTKAFAVYARRGKTVTATAMNISPLAGGKLDDIRRIVVSTDGGRIRVRRKKRGPKGKRGRDRYHADWREPKLVIIIMVNAKGRQDSSFPPLIDATMGGPDLAFSLLKSYLKQLPLEGVKLSFVSDGAKWIWRRVNRLFRQLGVKLAEVTLLLDYYHAAQHLNNMAAAKRSWNPSERQRWVKKMKKWLLQGDVSEVIDEMRQITKGTHSKVLRRELKYFESHSKRLGYLTAREQGLPIGSGAVESAVRRVINLRLKGPGIIWDEDGAEEMLMLRSFFKAGRWSQLESWAFDAKNLAT